MCHSCYFDGESDISQDCDSIQSLISQHVIHLAALKRQSLAEYLNLILDP